MNRTDYRRMETKARRFTASRTAALMLVIVLAAMPSLAAGEPCSNNQVPYVSISKPTNGQYFTWGATVRINADAGDADGSITNVEFFADGSLLGGINSPPYTNIWPSVYPPPEQFNWRYRLTARACDNCGICATSAPVEILNVQSPLPLVVTLHAPAGQTVFRPGSSVALNASVDVGDGSENPIEFYIGGQLLGSAFPPAYSVTLTDMAAGGYVITARYTDDFGNVGTSRPLTIAVTNLVLNNSRVNAAGEFTFAVSGVVTGASLILFWSSNLMTWEPLKSNVPTTPLIELNAGTASNRSQRFFRVVGER